MKSDTIRRFDQLTQILLLLWAGAALGFGIFSAPVFFQELPSRDLAGRMAGLIIERLDWTAWAVFGLAGMSWLSRWVAEVKEEIIGPIRLWSSALTVALLMCLASSFILTPKIKTIRARINAPIESVAPDHANRVAYNKAHGLSRNLFFLRILLALGLALTVNLLSREVSEDAAVEG